ncbi:MAG: hypothetical protein ACRDOO_21010 [Actinomadura sp.]
MTNDDHRLATARQAVNSLIDIVHGEGPWAVQWSRMLLDIRDALAEEGMPSSDVLATVAAMFDALYEGPYNFADFYVMRDDHAARVAANERLSEIVDTLRTTLHGEEGQ